MYYGCNNGIGLAGEGIPGGERDAAFMEGLFRIGNGIVKADLATVVLKFSNNIGWSCDTHIKGVIRTDHDVISPCKIDQCLKDLGGMHNSIEVETFQRFLRALFEN